jgi:galactokinase
MTGAGFGGCTVSIVKEEAAEKFIHETGDNYKKKIGLTADFYIAEASDGTRELTDQ